MIDTRLKTLLTLVETKSYTKTAEILFITQPAVTHHIKSIEKQNNIKLFSNPKTFKLSTSGQIIYDYALKAYEQYQQLELALSSNQTGKKRIVFSVTKQVAVSYLKPIMNIWLLKHPKDQIILSIDSYTEIARKIDNGLIDFAIIDHSFDKSKYEGILVARENIVLVGGKDNPYIGKTRIKPEVLKDAVLLLDLPNTGIRNSIDSFFLSRNLLTNNFTSVTEINDPNIMLDMTINNQGLSFLYESVCLQAINNGLLSPISVSDNDIRQDFYMICNNDNLQKIKFRKMAEEIMEMNLLVK